jgi:hypothetical protein
VAVYEAHAAGKKIAAHAISACGARNAVAAGFDSIEHGMYLDEAILAEMRERGTYLVPTLLAPEWIIRRAERRPGSVPEHMLAKARRVREAHAESFRRAVAAGVRIAFGSDTGVVPHGAAGEELSFMTHGGMSPLAAITAATATAADLLGVSGLTRRWQWLEELGYDSLWAGDHVWSSLNDGQVSRPRFDAWLLAGGIAAATTRVTVGTLVSSIAYRNPAVVAEQAMTADHISGGRLVVHGWLHRRPAVGVS